MPKLNIPYRSQWDDDAVNHSADCGPTCLAMILNYHAVSVTPDGIYDHAHLRAKKSGDFTSFGDLMLVARAYRLEAPYLRYKDRADAFRNLRANIDADKPMLALVNYKPWAAATGNKYGGGHFVVVTGYDAANIYIHDPLFGLWVERGRGAYFAMSHDLFAAGWGGFTSGNPNWACITVSRAVREPAPAPEPEPPAPKQPPVAPPTTAVSPPPSPLSDDIKRRIRTLATYRRAEMPDFNNASEVKLWQDHLGDFAQHYDSYVVQAGDTLSGLAGRFYDGQHRWRIIKAYNNLQRDGLWLGETVRIPRIGSSGAQNDAALPLNTIDQAKAIAFDDLIDPDATAQDYNDFGSNAVGIGFYEEG